MNKYDTNEVKIHTLGHIKELAQTRGRQTKVEKQKTKSSINTRGSDCTHYITRIGGGEI